MASIWRNKVQVRNTLPGATGPAQDTAPAAKRRGPVRKTATVVRLVAPEPPLDTTHAPAVRAFLADRLDGLADEQTALARAVLLARRVC